MNKDTAEETMQRFLDSAHFKEVLISHLCHTRQWHYTNQTLKVQLLPSGRWIAPSPHSWSQHGDCVSHLTQIGFHHSNMEAIGESRDFEDILIDNPDEARAIGERLYASQEVYLKQVALASLKHTLLREA